MVLSLKVTVKSNLSQGADIIGLVLLVIIFINCMLLI